MSSLRSRIAVAYTLLILLAIAGAGLTVSHVGRVDLVPALAFVVLLAIGATVWLSARIARAVTEPVERLLIASRALARGAVAGFVSGGGGAEVSELVSAFNEMAGRLQETLESREQARSRLEALLASSTDGLVALDPSGVVRFLNRAAVALYGEVEGRSFAEIVRSPELTSLLRARVPGRAEDTSEAAGRGQSVHLRIDDRDIWVEATVSAIAGGGGWSRLVVLHDVTEVRRAETTRRDFVANVSHELRTPLAGIKAVVETLRDGAIDDQAAADDFLVQVDGEVDRLVQLVEELLQLARMESGADVEITSVSPIEVLTGGVERFRPQADRAGVRLALDIPSTLPIIRANAAQIGQAVGNLVHNAIKFTPPGGDVIVGAVVSRQQLRISVADTGAGIDAADLPRIFERFYIADRARSGRGTGLGLAIVKHVVRAHDGLVDVKSQPGRGSTFTISLPIPKNTSSGRADRTVASSPVRS